MKNEDYEKLNNYLNDIFVVLDSDDSFLLRNLLNISALNDEYLVFIDKYNLEENIQENTLTYEDVYLITRDIIKSIDSSYLTDYDNLIKEGKLEFGYNDEYEDSCFIHEENLINIKREFNYNDVLSLVHEFIHYTNSKGKKGKNRYLLTEFLSIYFEIYATRYLLKQGISKNEINIYGRLKDASCHGNVLYNYEIIFLAYEKFGNLNENTSDDLNQYFLKISKKDFEQDCINFLNYINNQEIKYKNDMVSEENLNQKEFIVKLCAPFYDNYRYLLGTLLAFYAHKHSKIKDIVYLNNHINDFNIENLSLLDLLAKIGININGKDFISQIFDSIGEFINEYSNQKSR